jgi:hypothetical protein
MSYKISVPDASVPFKEALSRHIQDNNLGTVEFWGVLAEVSGWCQSVEIETTMGGIGGSRTLRNRTPFEEAVRAEFLRFRSEGYSAGDFQHILLDAWMDVHTTRLLGG